MLQVINPNSYIIAALTIFLPAFFAVVIFFRRHKLAWLGLSGFAVLLIAINLVLRFDVSEVESTAQFDQILATGMPVVLEIYSNY